MTTLSLVVTLIAVIVNGFSGVAAMLRFGPILAPMRRAGVPDSWLVFPIGFLKVAGAVGLLVGLWVGPIGVAAAIGLVLYFTCAVYTHLYARDFSAQFGLAIGLLALDAGTLALAVLH